MTNSETSWRSTLINVRISEKPVFLLFDLENDGKLMARAYSPHIEA